MTQIPRQYCLSLVLAVGTLAACAAPPDLEVVQVARSPDGRHVATAYTLSGGGAAGYVLYRVTLGAPVRDQRALGQDDVAQLRHPDPLRLRWEGPAVLAIESGPGTSVDTVAASHAGVRLRHAGVSPGS
jgi:hypothetical protein